MTRARQRLLSTKSLRIASLLAIKSVPVNATTIWCATVGRFPRCCARLCASMGPIRLTNEDVVDLYERVKVGAKVIVLPTTAAHRPSPGVSDTAFRLPDPELPSNRPSATNGQMLSSGPKIAEVH